jgi:3-dehydroquinate dehydratase/shikimate dehydrogenase
MGEIGMVTRILANRVGSPFTYATYSSDTKMAPGQLNWKEMTELYNYRAINEDTELFGVIADPVAHSYSPMIHNRAFQSEKLNACYLPFRVPSDDLNQFMMNCYGFGVRGISITIPHKERAMAYCTQAESSATGIGAINTMVMHGEEKLGYNTDYRAAMDCISELFEFKKETERPMQGMRAMVLGAGGVSRAIAWGLRQRAAEVYISSRTIERAEILAAELGCRVVPWDDRHEQKVHLLVNGTPIGMHPDVDSSPYNESSLNEMMVVFDTVYNPENTLLIKQAKKAKARVITGVDMFVRQAAYQYKLFTGRAAPVSLMRKTIKDATNPVQLN